MKCAMCKEELSAERTQIMHDERYDEDLDFECFIIRRNEAARAGDYEWFHANVPETQMTEDEKVSVGV